MAKQMYGTYRSDKCSDVGVKKGGNGNLKTVIAIVATAAILIGAFVFVYFKFLKPQEEVSGQMMVDTSAVDYDASSDPLANRMVSFAGINDATIGVGDTVALENLPSNDDFMMKFSIVDTDTDKEVFATDLIPAGKTIIWTPSDQLDKGVHHLSFKQTPFWMDANGEYIPLTAGNNQVELTIE